MKQIICIVLLIFSIEGFSQNLVQNPGFEQYILCPDDWTQLSRCLFWDTYGETPDYFNTCSVFSEITPPDYLLGYQIPHSGNAFIGLNNFYYLGLSRELVGSQLISSFSVGQRYFISLFVNLGGEYHATISSNKIGVKFSTVPFSYSNPAPINNYAHFYSNDIITDTVKWTRISGSFIADSAYNYIIIGNFFDDNNTDTVNLAPTGNWWAYYYIDDICVSTDSLYCENWLGIKQNENESKELTIYPNPNNGSFEISVESGNVIDKVNIYDSTGRIVYSDKPGHSNVYINLPGLPTGTYYTSVFINGITVHKKLIIVR